jgi:hypothetical protein
LYLWPMGIMQHAQRVSTYFSLSQTVHSIRIVASRDA